MGFTSLVCTYLYGSFAVIKTALTGYCNVAKNLLKRIDTLVSTLMTTVNYIINATIRTAANLIKQYEKELFDLLYSAVFGTDKSFWCNKLWKCAALLSELLDSDSWLNQKIRSYLDARCKSTSTLDTMDLISQSITDFTAFQQTVCAAGFSIEFGISYIKKLFEWCADIIMSFYNFLGRNIKRLKILVEGYLNTVIDWGIMDYLDKLISFFTCAFDDSYSCSEIATASNFYQDCLSKLKLEKNGQGYDVSQEFKNAIYGGLDGAKVMCSNLKEELDAAYAKCIDPNKLKSANAAYNLSKNIFPGGMSWTDLKEGNWKNNHMVKKFKLTKDAFIQAWNSYKPNDGKTFKELIDGTIIDQEGNIYVKEGCNYVLLNPYMPESSREETTQDYNVSGPTNNGAMLWNNEIISVTDAAIRIVKNAPEDEKMITECRTLYEFINDWKHNPDGVIRYATQKI